MKTDLAPPHPRRATLALAAALSGLLLASTVATAQESPPPAPSEAPAQTEPSPDAESPPAAASEAPPETGTSPAQATPQPRRWALATMPARPAGWILNDVIAGGPGFIAVGGGSPGRARSVPRALIWVSDAGRAWQSVPLFGDAAEGTIRAIAPTESGFVAVGEGPEGAAVWSSSDGIGWQRIPHADVFAGSVMVDVANGPAGLVAVGCEGGIDCATSRSWRSADGITWEALASPPPGLPLAIEATEDGYLVAGQQAPAAPMLASSPDGVTWTAMEGLPAGPAGLAALGTFGDELAGGSTSESGARRAILLRSADGTSWQAVRHRSFRAADFADVASSADGALLLGTRTQRARGQLRSRPLALWTADLSRFRVTPFPAQSTRAGGEVNAATFSPDGSLIVAVGATARPTPSIWFSRMATPRARGQGQGEARAPESTSQAPEGSAAETASPPTQAPSS